MQNIRKHFPALLRQYDGKSLVYLDGPAGTQVPLHVIDSISQYYQNSNANTHGHFPTSNETDLLLRETRKHVADFLGASSPDSISFGQNMTSLNFSLSKAFARQLRKGDKILITQLDHESNRGPWLPFREQGITVEEVTLLKNGSLDYDDFKKKIDARTKLVCLGYASNIFGTINQVSKVREWTHAVGALLLIDAVHYAPHRLVDVQSIDCDFLLCSAYKFYGPHVGILYCRPGLLDLLDTDHLRTQSSRAPYKIETGTLNHAALAGVNAAIKFIATLGTGENLRKQLMAAMTKISNHEGILFSRLYNGLQKIEGIKIYGPDAEENRTPTLSFTLEGRSAKEICSLLGEKGICAWDGHFYAVRATEVLGLADGVTRMGVSAYNTEKEIDRTINTVKEIAQVTTINDIR